MEEEAAKVDEQNEKTLFSIKTLMYNSVASENLITSLNFHINYFVR